MGSVKVDKTITTDDRSIIEINKPEDREWIAGASNNAIISRLVKITARVFSYDSEAKWERQTVILELSDADRMMLKEEL